LHCGRCGARFSFASQLLANSGRRQETYMGIVTSLLVRAPVDSFAKSLAQDIQKRYPPELDKQNEKRPSVNRLTRIVEDACKKAEGFRTEHSLGWIGKAALGNSFRWELTEMGYRKDFVDFATEAVVVHVSRKSSAATKK
jgi:hypothetical protein